MIRLNVFIQVDEKNHDAVVAAAKELVAASLKDQGCIAYDLFQSATRPDVLMVKHGQMPLLCRLTKLLLISPHWFPGSSRWLP